ncbi:4Fe-4S binding domain-containing protein [Desulforamulus putei DSM 12395]|uniref:4Fe-4S binding domain-containing protein n=1 Tax=Desulforamulus putei DSM 12395 TaxID=1121429 RepID=A0A1M5C7G3_9FIRM|nr:4Fe-4S binding domain-containing protein [Desulforamulus putei DSM 12395]
MASLRSVVQTLSTLGFNSYLPGFLNGTIYRGPLKAICLPSLNCYSCPGAVGSCPIGSLQAMAAGLAYHFSFYVFGLLMVFGVTLGRLSCGWLCPFGFLQDLLYRLPTPKFSLPNWCTKIKYVLLSGVLLIPLIPTSTGIGVLYFCQWLCPAGTLEAAIPLYFSFPPIRTAIGALFGWRILWLLAILLFVSLIYRGFCRTLCPLGAFYSFFNRYCFFRIHLYPNKCNQCGRCSAACPMELPVTAEPNHPECIRCLKCTNSCPTGAIQFKYAGHTTKEGINFEA